MELVGPVGNGWVKSREILVQEKTIRIAVPEAIVELVCCKCKKGCKMNVCGEKAGLSCTDVCVCNKVQEWENSNDYHCYDSSDDEK